MKYFRLSLLVCMGLLLMGTAAGIALIGKIIIREWVGYELSQELFAVIMFGAIGAAFSFAARICLKEIRNINSASS
jgi:hypothetical protein